MSTANFFDESREQSLVKAEIVEKYFDAWAGIIIGAQKALHSSDCRIGYIDLFAGPGRYKDGAVSTPLRVLQKAIEKPQYRESLLTVFNDKDDQNTRTLDEEIKRLPGYADLKHKPEVWNQEVGDNIAAEFARISTIPLLAFIDPWGYKGLTLRLVNAFLKNWGCDCIFFFNYSRINAGLSNPLVREHMAALFGPERAARLAEELAPMSPEDREATVVNELALALREHGAPQQRFVLPFCFKNGQGGRTTHHLILVTKHFRGYEVMKGIMANASSTATEGVPSFTYSPATRPEQMLLFKLNSPLARLRNDLLKDMAGRTLRMRAIYEEHSIDRPYIAKNYKDVLTKMENAGEVKTSGRKSKRGFADDIVVTFP
jgi:three-Cys-motif partner protein